MKERTKELLAVLIRHMTNLGARMLHHRLGLVALLLAAATPARAACPQITAVPLTLANNQLFVTILLNGTPADMQLDTGAGITVISSAAAGARDMPHDFDHHADLGGVGGANSALYIGHVDSIAIGGITLKDRSYPIVDMPQRSPGGAPASGLLGADILKHFDIEIDIPAGKLGFYQTSCADTAPPWQDAPEPIGITLDAGAHILTPFKLEGIEMTGVLDTGASWFTVTARAALRTGLSQDDLAAARPLNGTGVNARGWNGYVERFHSVQIGNTRYANMPTAVVQSRDIQAYDGLLGQDSLLGMNLLKESRLWISYRARQLYIQHQGG